MARRVVAVAVVVLVTPSLDNVLAVVVEAAVLIAITMFAADVLRAKLDPRARE